MYQKPLLLRFKVGPFEKQKKTNNNNNNNNNKQTNQNEIKSNRAMQ